MAADCHPSAIWISLRVATDVLPLLVHACSEACVQKLPEPPSGYGGGPHQGGLELQQPQGHRIRQCDWVSVVSAGSDA